MDFFRQQQRRGFVTKMGGENPCPHSSCFAIRGCNMFIQRMKQYLPSKHHDGWRKTRRNQTTFHRNAKAIVTRHHGDTRFHRREKYQALYKIEMDLSLVPIINTIATFSFAQPLRCPWNPTQIECLLSAHKTHFSPSPPRCHRMRIQEWWPQ